MIRIASAALIALLSSTSVFAEDAPAASAPTSAAKEAAAIKEAAAAASTAPAKKTEVTKKAEEPKKPAKAFVYQPKISDVIIGKESAPVTIVEYASLSCPHCAHFFQNVLPAITTKYIDTGKVKLVYRNFPLNDPALKAAELVQCAEKDRRHAFVKVLFSTQTKWAYDIGSYRDALGNIAVLGGMDRLKFESCMNDKAVEKIVLDVAKQGSDEYQINSTPTFYINGVIEKGDHDVASMSKVIDEALAKVGQK